MSPNGQEVYLTEEGLQRLEEELHELKTERRPEVAELIRDAKEAGDISENAAYDEAKNQQAFVEGRVRELEQKLRDAVIIAEQKRHDRVGLGHHVTIREVGMDDLEQYMIVGSTEAAPSNGRISNVSPLGSALLDHGVGDVVSVDSPGGSLSFEIVKIE